MPKRNRASRNRCLLVFLIFAFLTGIVPQAYSKSFSSKRRYRPSVTAEAAYVVDYTNRRVLFSRNAHRKYYPASTVKLLTALVVLDNKGLKDRILITQNAVNVFPTKAGLSKGAYYSVEDLLKVLLATSANDAAVALAEAVAGSEREFSVLMNKKAKALGARESHFTNSTGLPDKQQVTTAYDLAVITRAAFSRPFISSVMRQKSVTISGSNGKMITRPNHNKLLWRVSEPCVLGKTGYTRSAYHCYAGIAYYKDSRVSVVILKSRKPWSDICAILNIPRKKK